jgi:hypothetical protein
MQVPLSIQKRKQPILKHFLLVISTNVMTRFSGIISPLIRILSRNIFQEREVNKPVLSRFAATRLPGHDCGSFAVRTRYMDAAEFIFRGYLKASKGGGYW